MPDRFAYCPYYCEENAYLLCADERIGSGRRAALFITNATRTVVMRGQKVAGHSNELAVWDYHVVVLVDRGGVEVWDLDTMHGLPIELSKYLDLSFPRMPPHYRPAFRLVDAAAFRDTFSTDRRHMRTRSGYRHPPPPWDPPGNGHNLDRFLDLRDPLCGRVLDRAELEHIAAHGLSMHASQASQLRRTLLRTD